MRVGGKKSKEKRDKGTLKSRERERERERKKKEKRREKQNSNEVLKMDYKISQFTLMKVFLIFATFGHRKREVGNGNQGIAS